MLVGRLAEYLQGAENGWYRWQSQDMSQRSTAHVILHMHGRWQKELRVRHFYDRERCQG
jgi:hypothetical protein